MPRFAIIGTVEIASGRMNEFLPLLMAQCHLATANARHSGFAISV